MIFRRWVLACVILILGSFGAGSSRGTARAVPADSPGAASVPAAAGPTARPDVFEPGLRFESLTFEDGLSQGTVRSILRDRQGYIWFGTDDGLDRYDGIRFQHFRHDPLDPSSLGSSEVTALLEDRTGRLWVGTRDAGLNRYDPQSRQFRRYDLAENAPAAVAGNAVRCLGLDNGGQVWIGTAGEGLALLDPISEKLTFFRLKTGNPVSAGVNTIHTLLPGNGDVIWLGTDGGLARFDPRRQQFTQVLEQAGDGSTTSGTAVTALVQGLEGTIWVGGLGGRFGLLDPASGVYRHLGRAADAKGLPADSDVQAMALDQAGSLWLATTSGLYRYDTRSDRMMAAAGKPGIPYGLEGGQLVSAILDPEGILWLGGERGVNKLYPHSVQFRGYTLPAYLQAEAGRGILAVELDAVGNLWLGTDGSGLFRLDLQTGEYSFFRNDPALNGSLGQDTVYALLADRQGRLWVGTDGGLNRLNPESGRFTVYRHDPADETSLGGDKVTSIVEDRQGSLWVGTAGGGLSEYRSTSDSFRRYQNDPQREDSLVSNTVWALHVDPDGVLWAGTANGLDRFIPQTRGFEHYPYRMDDPNSLSAQRVLSIFTDRQGDLWVGTTDGLNLLEQGSDTFRVYLEGGRIDRRGARGEPEEEISPLQSGLPDHKIYGIAQDDDDRLWISTGKGISRFDPQTATFHNYDLRDGLQGNEFNVGAVLQDSGGVLYFGGKDGLTVFHPQEIRDHPFVPPVVLNSLVAGDEGGDLLAAAGEEQIRLNWPNTSLEFSFTVMSLARPEKNLYACRLEGYDEDWITAGPSRSVQYRDLPGGAYTLRIQGASSDMTWNEQAASLGVVVVPPPWRAPWFPWAAGLLLLVVIAGGYRLRTAGLAAQARQLASQVAERTDEIQHRRQVAEGLREVLVRLNSDLPLADSLQFIVGQVYRLVRADRVCLFETREGTPPLVAACHPPAGGVDPILDGAAAAGFPQSQCLDWFEKALEPGLPVLMEHLAEDPGAGVPVSDPFLCGARSVYLVPVIVEKDRYGGLAVAFSQHRQVSREDQEMVVSFADQVALAVANDRLRKQAEELAVVRERNRLARDLHDAITQTLFSASLIAEALPSLWQNDPGEGERLLHDLRQLNRGALAEMRTLLMELRPSAVVDARLQDLLQQLAEAASGRTGMAVNLVLEKECRLPDEVHVGFYRIAQEALTNVVRHSRASRLDLSLVTSPPAGGQVVQATLEICDNGVGFDQQQVPPDHFGLRNIRERAQAIGARLEINSQPGKGTCVRAIWKEKT